MGRKRTERKKEWGGGRKELWKVRERNVGVGERNYGDIIRDRGEEQRKGKSWALEKDLG